MKPILSAVVPEALLLCCGLAGPGARAAAPPAYPSAIAQALLAQKTEEIDTAARAPLPAAYALVADNLRWPAGENLIVAVYGGRYEVWKEISAIANEWSKVANIRFDFGLDPVKRSARQWNPSNPKAVPAHVRIRLDVNDGSVRYSAIGQESFSSIFDSGSMVLGGYARRYPLWNKTDRADIRHEFGHVLGFIHEQQRSECTRDFRLTAGENGEPTIFEVFLAVHGWEEKRTRTNLLLDSTYKARSSGPPDRSSVFMYPMDDRVLPGIKGGKSWPCYTRNKNLDLSPADIARAHADYPNDSPNTISGFAAENIEPLKTLAVSNMGALSAAPLIRRLETLEQAFRPLVYIQISHATQRPSAELIRSDLQAGGYIAPGIENIEGKARPPGQLEIRYFIETDKRQADSIAELVKTRFPDARIDTRLVRMKTSRKPPVEIWLPSNGYQAS